MAADETSVNLPKSIDATTRFATNVAREVLVDAEVKTDFVK